LVIILLLAPTADHKSLQARLLGHQIDSRHLTLSPGQHAKNASSEDGKTAL
jgi:hypothetical protein